MADNQYGLEAQWQLNRLAGTLDANKRPLYDIDEAANIWAGTVDLPLVAALNYKAGLTGFDRKDFVGVCNVLAGTTGFGAPKALSLIPDALGTLGQDAVFWIDANRGGTAGQRISNLGTAGSLLDVQVGSTAGAALTVVPGSHVYLPSVAGNNLSVLDEAALDITGDIDIRCHVALDDWTPTANQVLVSKYAPTGNQRSYMLRINATTGTPSLFFSTAGTSGIQKDATIAPTVADGNALWIRATLDVDNGASGYDVKFFTSEDGSTWTQLGSTVTTAGTTSVYAGTAPVYIGDYANFDQTLAGKMYRAQIFNGINGTKVLDVDCAQATTTSNLFTAVTGQTVTINRSGADSNDPKWLAAEDRSYVYTPGTTGNGLTVPDAANLDITGDIDLRWYGAMDDWTPSGDSYLIAKAATSATDFSYGLLVRNTNGILRFVRSADGTTIVVTSSTVAVPVSDGEPIWVRVTYSATTGDTIFYTSVNGSTWTQLGSTVTTTPAAIYSGPGGVAFNAIGSSLTGPNAGKMYRAQIFNGIDGTKVLDVDCSVLKSGSATSFTAVTGQTVTINRSSSGRKTVVVPSRVLEKVDDKHVYLPGVSGNRLSVPDDAQLDIAGDIDLRAKIALDDWTPAGGGYFWGNGSAGVGGYVLGIDTSGRLLFYWYESTTLRNEVSSVAVPATDGTTKWVRVILDVNNGSSQYDVKFYTSDDGTTWTQLGTTKTGTTGVTSIAASNKGVTFGANPDFGAVHSAGRFYRGQVLNGIDGTLVLDIDCNDAPLNFVAGTANSFTAKTGQTVTMNSTSGSGMQVVDARSATGSSCWLFGTDDYIEVNNRWIDGTTKNVYLPGVAGNYLSAPDSAALDVTGDIDIRVKVALDDWTPGAFLPLVSKWANTSNQRGYAFFIRDTNTLFFATSTAGTSATVQVASTVAPTVTNGSTLWVRVTMDVDNGAGGNDVKFWTSTDGTTWTQLGTTVTTAGTTSIFNSSAELQLGGATGATGFVPATPFLGRFYRAVIYSDLTETTKVFDANMETAITSVSQTTFTESSTNAATVTINKSGTGYVSTPVVESGYIYPTGVANLSASAVSLLDFNATDSFTVLIALREWATPVGYGRIIDKATQFGANGYSMQQSATNYGILLVASDGTNNAQRDTGNASSSGALTMFGMILDRSAQTIRSVVNSTLSATASTTSVGSLANNFRLRIGSRGDTATDFQNMEVFAAAIFRRALSAAEIKAIVEYYQRTVK